MTGNVFWTVFRKEGIDALRDRRTLSTVLFTSVLMGPLALVLVTSYVERIEARAEQRTVYVDGKERSPGLINFLERQGYSVEAPPEAYETELRAGHFTEAVVRPRPEFTERIGRGEAATVELVFDDSHNEGEPSRRMALDAIRAFEGETAALRLASRGISTAAIDSVKIEQINLAPPRSKGAQLLVLIPMFALIACAVGAMSIAIDVTAGERERGSLEPLLMTPARTFDLVAGKWAVVTACAWAVVGLTLAGFGVSMKLVQEESVAAIFQFGWSEALVFLAVLLPFSTLISAAMMLVSTWGRTYKEAQTYGSYLLTAVNLVPLFVMFLSVKDAAWQRFVPALGQQMVMARATRGESIALVDLIVPGVISVVGAMVALFVLARLLRDERVVFGRSG